MGHSADTACARPRHCHRSNGRVESGGFGGWTDRGDGGQALGRNRVVASMSMTAARHALFFDVRQFATGCHLAITPHDAAARERGVPQKSYETHDALIFFATKQQLLCR